ncbi:MAG: LysM domain-containing protein [Dehalococcoidia bacterium]|nr:LysM domain-containing protein [Dehalococcoidia bacterium]
MKITPRPLLAFLCLALPAALLLALAACGGGGDSPEFQSGRLTDPRKVPTVTPWQQPPEVKIVDPDSIVPISGGGTPLPSATTEPGEPGVCGETYKVVSGDTMFGIADKCGVDPHDLIDANPDVNAGSLSVGQVIKVPAAASPAPSP